MARWKLLNAHHLRVPGNVWEYKEVDRSTGKNIRKQFDVPQLLDPKDPSDWNYRLNSDEGEIIVCNGTNPEPKDIIFVGSPTPDMLPLDDEAKVISASFAAQWQHPIEDLGVSYSQSLVDKFQDEMAKVQSATKQPEVQGMSELLTAMTRLMEQNATLMAALAPRVLETVPEAKPSATRRA